MALRNIVDSMRQHVVTKTNFLERIVVAFEISKQTPS